MRNPKDKAKELVNKFYSRIDKERLLVNRYWSNAKFCALIAVDELISISLPSSEFGGVISNNTTEYWNEVKNEIEKL
jgi:hypothetical protein